MGRRAATPTTEEEVAQLSLSELESEIRAAKFKLGMARNGSMRKLCQQQVRRLEKRRSALLEH